MNRDPRPRGAVCLDGGPSRNHNSNYCCTMPIKIRSDTRKNGVRVSSLWNLGTAYYRYYTVCRRSLVPPLLLVPLLFSIPTPARRVPAQTFCKIPRRAAIQALSAAPRATRPTAPHSAQCCKIVEMERVKQEKALKIDISEVKQRVEKVPNVPISTLWNTVAGKT